MDRLRGMEVYVRVVRGGSLTAAADGLGMTAQMVGNYVRSIERELDVRLLDRTTRSLRTTEAGRVWYDHCCEVLALVEGGRDAIGSLRAEPRGLVRVTAPTTFGTQIVAPSLATFCRDNPHVRIDLSLTDTVKDLVHDDLEVAVRIGEQPDSSLIGRSLGRYRMAIAAAPSYLAARGTPRRPEDLTEHACLGFRMRQTRRMWRFVRDGEDLLVPIEDHLSIDNGQALFNAATAGAGIILQPEVLLGPAIADGRLVRLLADEHLPDRPIHLIYRQDRQMTPKMRAIIDFALAHWRTDR